MSGIPLRIVGRPPAAYAPLIDDGSIQPGDCWRDPDWDADGRECWCVVLPNRRTWRTTLHASDGDRGMWEVTGTAPDLTVSPSIFDHSPGAEWHGWIRDGELVAV